MMIDNIKLSLTPKQLHMKNLIRDFTAEHGYSPSYQELMKLCNLKTPSAVHSMIYRMEERGHVKLLRGQERSVVVID